MRHALAPSILPTAALVAFAALGACTTATPSAKPAAPTPISVSTSAAASARDDTPLGNADRARQALARLTFGARPNDLAIVERIGVRAWVEQQLYPERILDPVADSVLGLLEITRKTAFDLFADHPQAFDLSAYQTLLPPPPKAMMMASDSTMRRQSPADSIAAAKRRMALNSLSTVQFTLQQEVVPVKLLRAQLSERQLLEVMTDFWENHFSVSASKVPNSLALVDYDRVIRAHALGKFRALLEAVATNPEMLFYLDNAQSSVDSLHPTAAEWRVEERLRAHPPLGDTSLTHLAKHRGNGVNENYARELMELHTLGVDGGYTQHDVEEVARCLTGWRIDDPQHGGVFAFHPEAHDGGEKVVLGVHIPGGGGVEDGETVLDLLARSPSTAHFIAKKLVIHFVSDDPPPALVDRAAQTFLRTDGDIREVMRTIIVSPEFNSRAAYRAKVKTPFELIASITRVMNATPDTTQRTTQLILKLGQPIYGRLTPDGWPDQGAAWMNVGALMNRVNLAAQVGMNQVPNIVMARWTPGLTLQGPSPTVATDVVIAATLAGDASPATRDVLMSVNRPPLPLSEAQRLGYLGTLVGIAIGSSEFQHR